MPCWTRHLLDVSNASLASAAATALDAATYWMLLCAWVDPGGSEVGIAATAGAVVGGIVHWTLSRFWVFQRFRAPIWRSALGYAAMSGGAAIVHGLLTQWWSGALGADVAWLASKGALWIGWTYPASRYLVFGGLGHRDTP